MTSGPPTTALPPVDREAGRRMWHDYAAAFPQRAAADTTTPEHLVVERFGDSVELADELLGLVLHGPKRATASLVAEHVAEGSPLPAIGGHWVACDGPGAPRAVVRSTSLRVGPVTSVDSASRWSGRTRSRTAWTSRPD